MSRDAALSGFWSCDALGIAAGYHHGGSERIGTDDDAQRIEDIVAGAFVRAASSGRRNRLQRRLFESLYGALQVRRFRRGVDADAAKTHQ